MAAERTAKGKIILERAFIFRKFCNTFCCLANQLKNNLCVIHANKWCGHEVNDVYIKGLFERTSRVCRNGASYYHASAFLLLAS